MELTNDSVTGMEMVSITEGMLENLTQTTGNQWSVTKLEKAKVKRSIKVGYFIKYKFGFTFEQIDLMDVLSHLLFTVDDRKSAKIQVINQSVIVLTWDYQKKVRVAEVDLRECTLVKLSVKSLLNYIEYHN